MCCHKKSNHQNGVGLLDKDNIRSVFSENFSEDFIRMTGLSTRFSVQGVVSACEYLGSLEDISGSEEAVFCLDTIMKMCRQLIMNADMSDLVLSASDSAPMPAEEFDTTAFLEDFAAGCTGTLGKKCSFVCSGSPLTFAFANKVMLRYLLLSIVRRTVIDGAVKLELDCSKTQSGIDIVIRTAESAKPKRPGELPEMDAKSFRQLSSALAAKMGGVLSVDRDCVRLSLPKKPNDSPLTLRLPSAEISGGVFSQYNVMLGDLGEIKYY